MNINMFFEFPGILILIGIVLLIVSIIVGLFAYRKVDKQDLVFTIEEDENNKTEPVINEEVILTEEQESIEESKPEINEVTEEKEEYVELSEIEKEDNIVPSFPKIEQVAEPKLEEMPNQQEEQEVTTIYGGNDPKKKFVFDKKEKTIYGEKQEVSIIQEDVEIL